MTASARFTRVVDEALTTFLDDRERRAVALASDLGDLVDRARAAVAGGKRVRAAFVYWGWQSVVAGRPDATHVSGTERDEGWEPLVQVAAAVELFQAAALVHDDIIDDSDTRRGAPSAHRAFAAMHADAEWVGDADPWGRAAAVLLGDLLLSWSDELVATATESLGREGASARRVYRRMREEVTLGQYLDVLEEAAWIRQEPSALLARAQQIALSKSARYSVQEPLLLGAAIAGADDAQRRALEAYGERVGYAFQMRDDLLGVFGDPEVTGKPAGDDLREGKRTVLIELTRRRLTPSAKNLLDELLGDRTLDERQIAMLQDAILDSGALDQLERTIDAAVGQALEALRDAGLSRSGELELERLAAALARRDR